MDKWQAFDIAKMVANLNSLPHCIANIEDFRLHCVRITGDGKNSIPIILLNGWPSNFAEFQPLIERLQGIGHYDIIIPSLPGYGFSELTESAPAGPSAIASAVTELLSNLGYAKWFVHASDLGAAVTLAMMSNHPDRLLGCHFANVYWGYPKPPDLSTEERDWLAAHAEWFQSEGAYAAIQATKPATLAPALSDSPAAMAAWILEKWHSWSDGGLDQLPEDAVLTQLSLQWFTNTASTSIKLYSDAMRDPFMATLQRTEVPTGVLILPQDTLPAPRSWGERFLNVIRWTEADRGGHFPAIETPNLLCQEIIKTMELIEHSERD